MSIIPADGANGHPKSNIPAEIADLARRGYPIFPVTPQSKKPAVHGGFYAATTDLDTLAAWAQGRPGCDWAVATGIRSGVVAIDADTPTAARLMADVYGPPDVETRRGAHWYFRHPQDGKVTSTAGFKPGLDRKADGGYVVVPPSANKTWNFGIPDRGALLVLPADLRGGKHDDRADDQAGTVNAEAADAIAAEIPPNGRHDLMLMLTGVMLRYGVGPADVTATLIAAWEGAGALTADARADIEGGVSGTAAELKTDEPVWGVPTLDTEYPGLFEQMAGAYGWGKTLTIGGKAPGTTSKGVTPLDVAGAVLDAFGGNVAHSDAGWRRYTAGAWESITEDEVARAAIGIVEDRDAGKVRTALIKDVLQVLRWRTARRDWDTADVLVLTNGTVDLDTLAFREHRPDDYATSRLPYAYDPTAACPSWDAFLSDRLAPDVSRMMRLFVGYALTRDTRHEMALWLLGDRGTGKSTFLETVAAAFGERADSLGLGDIERSQFALSRVPGKTLLTATEQPTGHPRALHVLNALISGEPISIEGKFRDAYTYRPAAKLIWAMNQPPSVADATSGLFRRIRVVVFPRLAVVPDPSLKSRLADELPGVLLWALEGLRELRKRQAEMHGVDAVFDVPPSVDLATAEYEASQDTTRLFIDQACIVGPDKQCRPGDLYAYYRVWMARNGYGIKNSGNFYADLDRLGYTKGKTHGTRLRRGLFPDPALAHTYPVSS